MFLHFTAIFYYVDSSYRCLRGDERQSCTGLTIIYSLMFLCLIDVTRSYSACRKYEEIYPPDVGEFVYITDDTYTKQQVCWCLSCLWLS